LALTTSRVDAARERNPSPASEAVSREITFIASDGKEAFGISLWDKAENAEAYTRGTYPEVARLLASVAEGTPQVETHEVCNSTCHKIAAAVAARGRQFFSFGEERAKSASHISGEGETTKHSRLPIITLARQPRRLP